MTESIQQEYKALQDEGARPVQDRWAHFSKQFNGFVASVDIFFTTPEQPKLGDRTAALIQQGLDILDQGRFLNLETLFNQFLPKSIDELKEQAESVLMKVYKERIFPQIKKTLEQIQGGGLYLPLTIFSKLSYLEQDVVLLNMELVLKLFEEVALITDKIELQFYLKEHSLASRIFPGQVDVFDEKLAKKKPGYDVIFLMESDIASEISEEKLSKLSGKKSPILIKKEADFLLFGNLQGKWTTRKLTDSNAVIAKFIDSAEKAIPASVYGVLEACHAPRPSLRETIAQTYTTLTAKYKECMLAADYLDRAAIEFYPYQKAIAAQRKKISAKLEREIRECQQQVVITQPVVLTKSIAAINELIRKRSKTSSFLAKSKKDLLIIKFKAILPSLSPLSTILTQDQAKTAHLSARKAYQTVVVYAKTHKIPKKAITAPYKAWEKLTLTLAQLTAQKNRVDKLITPSLVLEEKAAVIVGLDELSLEIRTLYSSTQELVQALVGESEDSKEIKISTSSLVFTSIKESIGKWEKKIIAALDEDTYHLYVADVKAELSSSSHWLLQLGNGLADIKKTIALIEGFIKKASEQKQEEHATPASNMQVRIKNTEKLFKELNVLTKSFDGLRKKFKDEDQKLISLEVPTQFVAYISEVPTSSLSEIKVFSEILINKINEKLKANPFFQRLKKLKKCDTPLAFFEMIIKDPLLVSLQPTASAAAQRGLTLFNDYKAFTADYLSPPGVMAKIGFAFRHFSTFNVLAAEADVLKEPLRLAYQEAGLKHAEELNDFFCALFLWVDELEMQLFLKEGFLAKPLYRLMKDFNQQLTGLGYEFSPEKRYPYTASILQQRQDMQAHDEKQQSAPVKALRVKRLQQAKDKRLLEEKASVKVIDELRKKEAHENSKLIQTAINQRIMELKRKRQCFSTIPARKIALLEKLILEEEKEGLDLLPLFCLHERLEKLKHNPDYYLLFEGRTGECLRALKYHGATHVDLIMELNSELDKLKYQREGWVLFYKRLENKIKACKKLRDLLNRPGYSLKEALADLKAIDRPAYDVLLKYENPLLQKIRTIEGHIPEVLRPKKQILRSVLETDEKVKVKKTIPTKGIIAHIDREIRLLREQRYDSVTFFARNTKTQLESGIQLLTKVKKEINSLSLNFSVEEKNLLENFAPTLLKELTSKLENRKSIQILR